jgi:hypothetical protein
MDHADRVDRWLGQAAKGLSGERRLLLFERAMEALWRRAHVTLGEVTLGAVTERVFYFAAEKFPFLAPLRVEPDGVHFEELRKSLDPSNGQATEAFRFVLVEWLTILGNLTDDITPALHSALSKVAVTGEKNSHGPPRSQEGEETPQ